MKVPDRHPPTIAPDLTSQKWALVMVMTCFFLLAGLVIVLQKYDPVKHKLYPRCSFHVVTGLHCPGCGGLRSMHHLTNGRLATAFQNHPAFVLSLPLWGWILGAWGMEWWRTGRVPSLFTQHYSGRLLIATAGLFLFLGILRNLPWKPFQQLVPPEKVEFINRQP